jgi:hypothetical protein
MTAAEAFSRTKTQAQSRGRCDLGKPNIGTMWWMFIERPGAAQPTGVAKRGLDTVLTVRRAVDEPWFAAHLRRRLRARLATLSEYVVLHSVFNRTLPIEPLGLLIVVIASRHPIIAQYVAAPLETTTGLDEMDDDDILAWYKHRPGVRPISEFLPFYSLGTGYE